MKSKRIGVMKTEERQGMPLVLFDRHNMPHDVYGLAAFCQEWGLDYEKMRNVAFGRSKNYQGWHLDPAEAVAREKRIAELDAMARENEAKYEYSLVVQRPDGSTVKVKIEP